MAEKKKDEKTFEEKEKRLDEIISRLQQDKDLTLKETTALYAEGKQLIQELNEELKTLKALVTNEIVSDK
jgi:exodeoxyribonuclease VII small subunit